MRQLAEAVQLEKGIKPEDVYDTIVDNVNFGMKHDRFVSLPAHFIGWLIQDHEQQRAALRPFAELAGKLDGAPNLVGLLTEADFKHAASAYTHEQSGESK